MSLKDRLVRDIRESGPITVADYVTRCLHDPQDGYYATRPRLGAGGDFITAPLVSQMFGELIGLWALETWRRLGAPDRIHLIEVGPGDGTLISDALRAAHIDPAFVQALDLVLIEPSGPLREAQARMLARSDVEPRWVRALEAFEPDAPVILIANEVLDCLPARQYVRTEDGWAERRVGVDEAGELMFGHARIVDRFARPEFEVAVNQVFEIAGQQATFGTVCAELVKAHGGAALLIDYGRDRPEAGDTLQAWYYAPLQEAPGLDETQGDWRGKPLVSGTYTLALWGYRSIEFQSGSAGAYEWQTYRDTTLPGMKDFLFGASATTVTPYSKIDSGANCNGCHDAIAFHGAGRLSADTCMICHATPGPTVNYRTVLHELHAETFPAFPNGSAECVKCHGTTDVTVPVNRSHPTAQGKPAQDWTVACTGCHTSASAGAHADTMISPSTGAEACETCHGPGKDLAVQEMHRAR